MLKTGTDFDGIDLAKQLKTNTKKDFSDADMELIEKVICDDDFDSDEFKESLITFSDVLRSNKRVGASEYIKAVQFCSHMSTGSSQLAAYSKTFPDRVAKKKAHGTVVASASLYHKTDLVQGILRMAQIPAHLIFMAERHKAISTLAELMSNPDSTDRIKMESADKILNHIKPPEESKLTVDLNVKNDTIENLEATLERLAQIQIDMVGSGMHTAKDVVDADIITKES